MLWDDQGLANMFGRATGTMDSSASVSTALHTTSLPGASPPPIWAHPRHVPPLSHLHPCSPLRSRFSPASLSSCPLPLVSAHSLSTSNTQTHPWLVLHWQTRTHRPPSSHDRLEAAQHRHTSRLSLDVSHPDTENYGKHWTSEAVRAYFQPSQESVEAVMEWLVEAGVERARIPVKIINSSHPKWPYDCRADISA
ncbi:hypothetical protein B0H12DRAFT_365175 [Mycena haematopus]|nr:hypothetical protein B0H12DRAFT_365175 [Mycena haematopus]